MKLIRWVSENDVNLRTYTIYINYSTGHSHRWHKYIVQLGLVFSAKINGFEVVESASQSSFENHVFVSYDTFASFAATYVHQSAQNTRPFVSAIKLEFDI